MIIISCYSVILDSFSAALVSSKCHLIIGHVSLTFFCCKMVYSVTCWSHISLDWAGYLMCKEDMSSKPLQPLSSQFPGPCWRLPATAMKAATLRLLPAVHPGIAHSCCRGRVDVNEELDSQLTKNQKVSERHIHTSTSDKQLNQHIWQQRVVNSTAF